MIVDALVLLYSRVQLNTPGDATATAGQEIPTLTPPADRTRDCSLTAASVGILVTTVVDITVPSLGGVFPSWAENCKVAVAPAATPLFQYRSSPAVHGHCPVQPASPACACVTVVSTGTLACTVTPPLPAVPVLDSAI